MAPATASLRKSRRCGIANYAFHRCGPEGRERDGNRQKRGFSSKYTIKQ
jgi:hypothetical protein